MIVEQRTYQFHTGKVAEFMALYEGDALDMQKRILGNLLGYYVTELGALNQTVHLWGYVDLNQRQQRRNALLAEPDWRAFLAKVLPLIHSQESKILLPTSFSPQPDLS